MLPEQAVDVLASGNDSQSIAFVDLCIFGRMQPFSERAPFHSVAAVAWVGALQLADDFILNSVLAGDKESPSSDEVSENICVFALRCHLFKMISGLREELMVQFKPLSFHGFAATVDQQDHESNALALELVSIFREKCSGAGHFLQDVKLNNGCHSFTELVLVHSQGFAD